MRLGFGRSATYRPIALFKRRPKTPPGQVWTPAKIISKVTAAFVNFHEKWRVIFLDIWRIGAVGPVVRRLEIEAARLRHAKYRGKKGAK
jgi:hypothetical protein